MILFAMKHLLFFLSVFLSHWVFHTKVLMREVFMASKLESLTIPYAQD